MHGSNEMMMTAKLHLFRVSKSSDIEKKLDILAYEMGGIGILGPYVQPKEILS